MSCEIYLDIQPRAYGPVASGGVTVQSWQFYMDTVSAYVDMGIFTCSEAGDFLEGLLPGTTDVFLPASQIFDLDAIIFNAVGGPGDYGGSWTLAVNGVNYGFWVYTALTGLNDQTTYPTRQIDMTSVFQITISYQGDVGTGFGTMAYNFPQAVNSIPDKTLLMGCLNGNCSIGPPVPPFPPFLPPSPQWPNITPAPLPPTPSFPAAQLPNMVLTFGANYSIFSNFGFKG